MNAFNHLPKNKVIAIITARGGSKRILNKNIRDFGGVPIIKYSIDAAVSSGLFQEVMVSTDSEEISDIAKKLGASVPFLRSKKNSDDFATTFSVIREVLNEYAKRGHEYSMYCCLYPTAVFVDKYLLINSYNKLVESEADFLVPIYQIDNSMQRAYRKIDGRFIEWKWPEYSETRTQDLEELFLDCGQFYFGYSKPLLAQTDILRTTFIELPAEAVQDIDTEEDWITAEKKYLRLSNQINQKVIKIVNLLDTAYTQDILAWRNQDFVRNQMINLEIISQEQHQEFLRKLPLSDSQQVHIIFENDKPFGVMTAIFDHEKKEIDLGTYLISQHFLGTGKGLLMSYIQLEYVFSIPGYVATLRIKDSNQRNVRLQTFLGFEKKTQEINTNQNEEDSAINSYILSKEKWEKRKKEIVHQLEIEFKDYCIAFIHRRNT